MHPLLTRLLCYTAWAVAVSWTAKLTAAALGLPRIPNLILPEHDLTPIDAPSLTVIVPARNEAADITACLQSLLAQDYPNLTILAVNDRSTDHTGTLMDALASDRLEVLHITDLPPGWLGKTHAMATAAALATTDYVLFTDADVLFRPDALRRSLAYAQQARADHLITLPTTLIRRWDEAALLGFIQILGLWGAPLWRIAVPSSRHALGVGAFNLLRRPAYEQIGGFAAVRMEVVEDLGLGRRIKQAGLRQRVAFGRGLVSLHWAAGAHGIVNVMTKNIFSAFRFNPWLLLFSCGWLVLFCILPFAAIFYRPTLLAGLLTIALIATAYRLLSPHSGLSAWNALLAPFAAVVFIYALLKSMLTTLRQGGVIWRGTFYSLAELKQNTPPLF